MDLKPVVRRRGKLKGGNKSRGRFGSGVVELEQLGNSFQLKFKEFQFLNQDESSVGLFLSYSKGKPKIKDLEDYGERQELQNGIENEEGRANVLLGLYNPEYHGEISEFTQTIDSKKWPNIKPLDLKSLLFAKHEDWKPKTVDPVVYCYANLEVTQEEKRKSKQDVEKQRRALEEAQRKIINCITWEKGKTLEQITKIVKPRLKYYDKDNSGEVDFGNFQKILENLGLFMHEAQLFTYFRKCDLDGSGALSIEELPFALYVIDQLNIKPYISPLYTFKLFDADDSGELNEHEFYEALQTMCITTMSRKETSILFRRIDVDCSGVIEYEEFKMLWLRFCNAKQELQLRGVLQQAKEEWRQRRNWLIMRKGSFFKNYLLKFVNNEEMKEIKELEEAFTKALTESKKLRIKKDEKSQKLHRERKREAIAARLANYKAERKEREFQKQEKRKREKFKLYEKNLRRQLDVEIKERTVREKAEREKARLQRLQQEKEFRSVRGMDILDHSNEFLRQVPENVYKGAEAQDKLTKMISITLANNKIESLPERGFLFWCTAARKLDVSRNRLETIPSEVEGLESLELLNLSENNIFILPKEIGSLKQLKKLNLGKNSLTTLPEEMGNLENIKSIILHENQLRLLNPEVVQNLSGLKILDLGLNQLEELPESIRGLRSLVSLDVSWNRLRKLSTGIGQLSCLETLDLSRNELRRLPDSLHNLCSLEILRIRHNELVELPESIGGLVSLLDMDISNNKIFRVPNNIGSLEILQRLDLSHNSLKTIPKTIGHLKSLLSLNLRDNKLQELPAEIGALFSLQMLDLAHNCLIGSLPTTIGALKDLNYFDISSNQLEEVPDSIGGLTSMKHINLSKNRLAGIPISIGCLRDMKTLDVSCNLITILPHTIGMLKLLATFDLSSNLVEWLPAEIGDMNNLKNLIMAHNRLHALPVSLGQVIPRLESFVVAHNPLDKMPKKWIDNWNDIKLRSSALWSGYTDGQAAEWAIDTSDVYRVAESVFNTKMGFFLNSGRLKEFIDTVQQHLLKENKWCERYRKYLEAFFFEARKLGCTPRYDALYGNEISERKSRMESRELERKIRQEESKELEELERIRMEGCYEVTKQKLIYVETKLEYEALERKKAQWQEEMKTLKEASKACYVRQEKIQQERMRQIKEKNEKLYKVRYA